MDLGCIDMGCVEKQRKELSVEKENSPAESKMSASKLGKSSRTRNSVRSSLTALNKISSNITKPPYRKTSPLRWFPRKKVEPYLKRKIKLLQEVDGMQSTLDETLGDSNPHYSRVLREKIAIKEAAEKAIEARKAAMVEASWCRILRAARIDSKEAEAKLLLAENSANEALEAAEAVGVFLNDIPDCAQKRYNIETKKCYKGGESATHTVSTTFETVFEVDKQVAAAVKEAFIKLASSPSMKKKEFQELLRKVSENPDTDESNNDVSPNQECESSAVKSRSNEIVESMQDRLRCLKEEELASLATIVATCGLNAALAEDVKIPCTKECSSRTSFGGRTTRNSTSDVQFRRETEAQLPSLDKFLVKRLTRLEREVLEAKNATKNEAKDKHNDEKICSVDNTSSRTNEEPKEVTAVSDIKLEKETEEEAKNLQKACTESVGGEIQEAVEVPSLDKFLVKRLTRLEREVQAAADRRNIDPTERSGATDSTNPKEIRLGTDEDSSGKENIDLNNKSRRDLNTSKKISEDANYESLDSVLMKHVSRLEREKMGFRADELMGTRSKRKDAKLENMSNECSLDQILVKHRSRIEREREKTANADEQDDGIRQSLSRRQAREKELQAAWGGLSLGNSIRPHVSRLERHRADWLKAEAEERKRAMEEEGGNHRL